MSLQIYHNPRCSKSREALALLEARGLQPEVIEYLKTTPSMDTLRLLQQWLGVAAHDMLRSSEAEFAALHLDDAGLSDEQRLAAIVQHPKLLQRPIVVNRQGAGTRAVIARPPELALTVL